MPTTSLYKRFASAANTPAALLVESPEIPPHGYRLVTADLHEIGRRDMVFIGGDQSIWQCARRAGEIGALLRYSAARSVACLV